MIDLQTPNGLKVAVPEDEREDPSPHFRPGDLAAIRDYYDANGYVVVDGVFDAATCDAMRALWEAEVKPSAAPIYRQATARLEANRHNAAGWVMNPILNLQSLDPRRYPKLRAAAKAKVFNAPGLTTVLKALLGERPKVVQSMYFEGNSATWEHQDSYYLDSEQIGAMTAAWIALEDIAPRAGRFFVCPGTHRLDWPRHSLADNVVDAHDQYVAGVLDKFRSSNSAVRAPALKKGAVLFWNALTIHGSLDSHDPQFSRSSITCHVIPESHRFLQLQHIVKDVPAEDLGNVLVFAPKDLARARYRAIKWAEWHFPSLFYRLKGWAVRSAIRKG